MSVGVVIIVAGRRLHLARVLTGLAAQTRPADQVVVVAMDDGPVDPAGLEIDVVRLAPRADRGLPLAEARNAGAARSSAEQLVFLDVDCLPATDLVERYAAVLDEHPAAIACGPVRHLRQGWDCDAATDAHALEAGSDPATSRPQLQPGERLVDVRHHELFWSLSFGIGRSTWDHLGGFDPSYVGYGAEDTDFGFRARAAGVPLVWFGGGVAHHQWHPPARHDRARVPELVANARRFHDRWQHWPMHGWLTELDALGWLRFEPSHDLLETM